MNAYIKLWGNEYLITSLGWHDDGKFSSASFTDERGVFHTIHDGSFLGENNAEEDRGKDVILRAFLDEVVTFKNKEVVAPTTTKERNT